MYRKYLQELSDRPATAHLQELSDRPATAHLQELSDRPATAHLQELSDRPATAHLQELSDRPVFPETHLIVGDAHLKAARAGAAHREQFRNSQIDCVTASISSSTTYASGDAAASQPLAVQLASQTVAVECQSVSGSTGHSIHAKPGGSNITVNQSPTLQSASHDSGVVTSPSAQNESRVTSSIHPEVKSSRYGSAARRFQVVKSIGRDSAVSCSPEDKYRGWSSSASLSSGVKSKGRGSTISQSPKVKARGRSSSVSQSPEVKSGDRISSISHSAEIKSRGRGSADSHSSEVKSRRRGSVISRLSEVKSRGRGISISHASEASYERPEKWDPHRYSETIQLEDFMSRTNTPEFRRRPVDYLVMNEEETITTKLVRSSQASRPSPKCMWDEDSFSSLSQDEVIVSRPVVDASIVNSPLYPTPRGDLILSILPEKGRHATPSLPPDVIKVKPIHKDSQEEPKAFLRGNGLTRPPSRFSSNIQVEMSPWGRHSPAPRTTQKAKMVPDTASTLGCYSVFCCRLRPSCSTTRR